MLVELLLQQSSILIILNVLPVPKGWGLFFLLRHLNLSHCWTDLASSALSLRVHLEILRVKFIDNDVRISTCSLPTHTLLVLHSESTSKSLAQPMKIVRIWRYDARKMHIIDRLGSPRRALWHKLGFLGNR